jgi:hypothetical protein
LACFEVDDDLACFEVDDLCVAGAFAFAVVLVLAFDAFAVLLCDAAGFDVVSFA